MGTKKRPERRRINPELVGFLFSRRHQGDVAQVSVDRFNGAFVYRDANRRELFRAPRTHAPSFRSSEVTPPMAANLQLGTELTNDHTKYEKQATGEESPTELDALVVEEQRKLELTIQTVASQLAHKVMQDAKCELAQEAARAQAEQEAARLKEQEAAHSKAEQPAKGHVQFTPSTQFHDTKEREELGAVGKDDDKEAARLAAAKKISTIFAANAIKRGVEEAQATQAKTSKKTTQSANWLVRFGQWVARQWARFTHWVSGLFKSNKPAIEVVVPDANHQEGHVDESDVADAVLNRQATTVTTSFEASGVLPQAIAEVTKSKEKKAFCSIQ